MNTRALPLVALGLPIVVAACVAPADEREGTSTSTSQALELRLAVVGDQTGVDQKSAEQTYYPTYTADPSGACKPTTYEATAYPTTSSTTTTSTTTYPTTTMLMPTTDTKPPGDAIALGTLLDASGYGPSVNSNWKDIASGNFCGGTEKELVVLKNEHSVFSIMRGPVPYPINTFDFEVSKEATWQAVAASDFDGDGYDEIVAVRNVGSATKGDLVLLRLNTTDCGLASASPLNVRGAATTDWHDVAIGTFDVTGKQIALMRDHEVFLVRSDGHSLTEARSAHLFPVPPLGYTWKQVAAGDLEVPVSGTPRFDELVAAREVSDGVGTTVVAYRMTRGSFVTHAESKFGNGNNSRWTGLAIGDFNADGQNAIALQRDANSNFAIMGLQSGALVELATSSLDTDDGQEWRGLTAIDWLEGDAGAAELVALRKAVTPFRTDLFVYGNPALRLPRDRGILGQKAEWDQLRDGDRLSPVLDDVASAAGAHVTTISWALTTRKDYPEWPGSSELKMGDYYALVDLLEATKDACVDGQRVRVSVTIPPKWGCKYADAESGEALPVPEDSPRTSWNDLEDFTNRSSELTLCRDTMAWAKLIGKLAKQYPHLVSFGIDDFVDTFPHETNSKYDDPAILYTEEEIAEIQSQARQRAPWLTFVPTAYYHSIIAAPPDFAKTVDTLLYYFRNEKTKPECVGEPCATASLANVNDEINHAAKFLPVGRKLQVGTYWVLLNGQEPENKYDYELVSLVRAHPSVGGVTAYSMRRRKYDCNDTTWLDHEYCTLEHAFRP
jgi:hypothetical protein